MAEPTATVRATGSCSATERFSALCFFCLREERGWWVSERGERAGAAEREKRTLIRAVRPGQEPVRRPFPCR